MTERTVPITFVRAALAIGRDHGVETTALLRRAGIAPAVAMEDRARITAEQVARLVRALWRITDDELFGLGPAPVHQGATRLIGLGLIHSSNLAVALDRFIEFLALTPGFPTVTLTRTDGVARFTMDTNVLRGQEEAMTTFLLGAAHRLMGWLIGHRIRLDVVELPHPEPANLEDYTRVFGAPLLFDADLAAFEFDAALLASPVVQTEESWLAYVERAPVDILSQREYGVALADRARSVLARGLSGEWASADGVAKALAMSPQTLRRRLALEDTSVSRIRDEILRDEAVASLTRGGETVEALSSRLGFSEPSAFRRAFRRWTGSPPRSYQHRSDGGEGDGADEDGS